jgi:hypothetical protein
MMEQRGSAKDQKLAELEFLLDFAEGAGGRVALAVFEDDEVFACEHGLEFLDLVEVDDDGAADAQELLRGEIGFQRTHGLAEDVVFLGDVDDGVFASGFDGVDLIDFDEGNFAGGFDGQSSELTGGCRRLT